MTQRVARPMKFAAFISIILFVAVLFVACQGAVGPAGEKGDKGDKGDTGAPGAPGTAGQTRLQPTADTDTIPVFITNGEEADSAGEAVTVTVSDQYFGGVGNISLGDLETEVLTAARIFTASIADGVITFAVRLDSSDAPVITSAQYIVQKYTLKVIDDGGPDLTLTFDVRRNRAPVEPDGANVVAVVGTAAPATAPSTVPMCPAANECYVDVTFEDADTDVLSFEAVSEDETKFTVVSVDNALDTNGE